MTLLGPFLDCDDYEADVTRALMRRNSLLRVFDAAHPDSFRFDTVHPFPHASAHAGHELLSLCDDGYVIPFDLLKPELHFNGASAQQEKYLSRPDLFFIDPSGNEATIVPMDIKQKSPQMEILGQTSAYNTAQLIHTSPYLRTALQMVAQKTQKPLTLGHGVALQGGSCAHIPAVRRLEEVIDKHFRFHGIQGGVRFIDGNGLPLIDRDQRVPLTLPTTCIVEQMDPNDLHSEIRHAKNHIFHPQNRRWMNRGYFPCSLYVINGFYPEEAPEKRLALRYEPTGGITTFSPRKQDLEREIQLVCDLSVQDMHEVTFHSDQRGVPVWLPETYGQLQKHLNELLRRLEMDASESVNYPQLYETILSRRIQRIDVGIGDVESQIEGIFSYLHERQNGYHPDGEDPRMSRARNYIRKKWSHIRRRTKGLPKSPPKDPSDMLNQLHEERRHKQIVRDTLTEQLYTVRAAAYHSHPRWYERIEETLEFQQKMLVMLQEEHTNVCTSQERRQVWDEHANSRILDFLTSLPYPISTYHPFGDCPTKTYLQLGREVFVIAQYSALPLGN
ncbi:MAG: hypothetical protein ACOCWQ_03800 [Nanoarchaeota archaeon]